MTYEDTSYTNMFHKVVEKLSNVSRQISQEIFSVLIFVMQTKQLAENTELESCIKDVDTELGYDCAEDFLQD